MSIIDKFKALPEAKKAPDSVWNVHRILTQIEELETQRQSLLVELETANDRMMSDLKRDWTDDELSTVGLISKG